MEPKRPMFLYLGNFNLKLYDGSAKLIYGNDYTFSLGKAMAKLNDKKL